METCSSLPNFHSAAPKLFHLRRSFQVPFEPWFNKYVNLPFQQLHICEVESLQLIARKAEMKMTKSPLAARLDVTAPRMSEFDEFLKLENETMAIMVCFIMFVFLAYFMVLLIFSASSTDSKIWQVSYLRFYVSTFLAAIVVMFLYAVYNVIAQAAGMWKEKDNLNWHQWGEDLSPQPFDL